MQSEDHQKFLAIDYGKKRIGLAIGSFLPMGLGVIDGSLSREEIFSRINAIATQEAVFGIVIGLPVGLEGGSGTLDTEIRFFAENFAKFANVNIFFENEQFSSAEAMRQLKESGKKIKRRSGDVDEAAAILVLEQFLNRYKSEGGGPDIKKK